MSDIEKTEETSENGKMQTRRKLLTSAARVAVTAPAVALLLSATARPAAAVEYDGFGEAGGTDGKFYSDDAFQDDVYPGVPGALDDTAGF